MSRDYLMRPVAKWDDLQPYDEWGHALDYSDTSEDRTKARDLTSPYGSLEFGVGSDDDFWCFDWGFLRDGRIALHATINSETGSFIMDAPGGYEIVEREHAVAVALGMIDMALEWCNDNEIKHSTKEWNQDPYYFARHLAHALDQLGRPLVRKAIKHRVP